MKFEKVFCVRDLFIGDKEDVVVMLNEYGIYVLCIICGCIIIFIDKFVEVVLVLYVDVGMDFIVILVIGFNVVNLVFKI